MNKKIIIGFCGFGQVGKALFEAIQIKNLNIHVKRILVRDISKSRILDSGLFCDDPLELLNDSSIGVIVEMINDPHEAFQLVQRAMIKRKHVITSNVKMVAFYLSDLIQLQHETGCAILYGATVGENIPLIRNLEDCYANEAFREVSGIINSPSNAILTKIFKGETPCHLIEKRILGVELLNTNPNVEAWEYDARNKLIIIGIHAFGCRIDPEDILCIGFQGMMSQDAHWARGSNHKIKLLARILRFHDDRILALVMPHFVKQDDMLHWVDQDNNGISLRGDDHKHLFFAGSGSGVHAIASALLSDITSLRNGYRYDYRKYNTTKKVAVIDDHHLLRIHLRCPLNSPLEELNFEEVLLDIRDNDMYLREGYVRIDQLVQFNFLLVQENVFVCAFIDERSVVALQMTDTESEVRNEKSIL